MYNLVTKVFIDEIGFEPDFYTSDARHTLIHSLVKARGGIDTDSVTRVEIIELVSRCNNLSLRDNQGKTIL